MTSLPPALILLLAAPLMLALRSPRRWILGAGAALLALAHAWWIIDAGGSASGAPVSSAETIFSASSGGSGRDRSAFASSDSSPASPVSLALPASWPLLRCAVASIASATLSIGGSAWEHRWSTWLVSCAGRLSTQ